VSAVEPGAPALLDLARRAAIAAGDLLLDRFGGPARGVETKSSPTDLVSDADRDAETLILTLLERERPGDAVLSEEEGPLDGEGLRWLVDPLDGTVNYLFGIPQWCVSVACEDRDGTLVAVVHDPSRRETMTATRGGGAWLGGRALAVRADVPLGQAMVATGFSYRAAVRARQADLLRTLLPDVRDIRRAGSAALDLGWLAAGRLDGYYEHGLNAWDWAAGGLLVREAGGVTEPLPAGDGLPDGLLAASPAVAAALRGRLPPWYTVLPTRGGPREAWSEPRSKSGPSASS
jgi:myo-inositol-1(or 4)-monophosphatase